MNQAMLAKASWRIFQGDPGLWNRIYKAKYLQTGVLTAANYKPPQDCSSTWRGISHGATLLRQNLIWRIGDGTKVSFWYDLWLSPLLLCNLTLPNAIIDSNAKVCDFWDQQGWKVQLLSSFLPKNIVQKILCTPHGFEGCGEDIQIWKGTSNGIFTVKSTFNSLFDLPVVNTSPWRIIWKLAIPTKLKTFIWVVAHGKLLTNVQRRRQNLTMEDSCFTCQADKETLVHLFRDYHFSKTVWGNFHKPPAVSNLTDLHWIGWLTTNLQCTQALASQIRWCDAFVFICWFIWKWRNKRIFY